MATEQKLLRISELARRTGASVATIRFYIREGLLPRPTTKTSRNMAYYDESFVPRIQLIRRLQQERHLPLRVIRSLVTAEAGRGDEAFPDLALVEAKVLAAMDPEPTGASIDRDAVIAQTGISAEDLDELGELGIVTPMRAGKRVEYGPEDVVLAETVARVRGVGLTRDLFPTADLLIYRDAISALVGEEARLFVRRVRGRSLAMGPQPLREAMVQLLGQLIIQLRRKLVLDLFAGLDTRERPDATPPARPAATPKRSRPRPKPTDSR